MFELKTTKLLTIILSIVYLVLGILGRNSNILIVLSAISAIAALTLVIAHLDRNDFEERFIWPLHGFALHTLLFGVTMLLIGIDGALFSRWYHAMLDALVVVSMLKLMKQNNIIICLAGFVTFGLSLVNLSLAVQLIFCVLAVIAVFTVVRGYDEISDLGYLCVLVIAAVLEKVFKIGNIEYWFHLLFTLFGLMIAFLLLKDKKIEKVDEHINNINVDEEVTRVVENKDRSYEVHELDEKALDNAPVEASNIEVETVDLQPVEEVNFTQFTRDWISEKYEKATLEDLYNAPVSAFKGVGDIMANKLDEALQIKSIKDLANSEFFKWATEILKESL